MKKEFEQNDSIVIGRNAVTELLKSDREVENVMIANGAKEGSIHRIMALCKEKGIIVKTVDRRKLDALCGGANHQGVIANTAAHRYYTLEELLKYAEETGENPFFIICDGIEDSHNLGAIIRTAEACGVHGVIIPKRRSVGLNFAVAKASCGALEHMRVARVTNLAQAVEVLKKHDIWVYAADMKGRLWCEADLSGGAALVIGSEGRGVSRLLKEKCDETLAIPMLGEVNSLNASVAAGVLMYEIVRQRLEYPID